MIVQVKQLTKQYTSNGPTVLDIPQLNIRDGEFFGLLGPNGAGKTSFFSILCGMLQPTTGTLHMLGKNVHHHARQIQQRIGLVPQESAIFASLSARENLRFFGKLYGLRGRKLKERIDYCLHLTRLTPHADRLVRTYSGGMKRLVNFSIGIIHQPQLLILDEPTLGVDTQTRHDLFNMIADLNNNGMSVIHTTHYIEDAERLCSRVAILHQGKILCQDTPAQLIQNHPEAQSLEQVFLSMTHQTTQEASCID